MEDDRDASDVEVAADGFARGSIALHSDDDKTEPESEPDASDLSFVASSQSQEVVDLTEIFGSPKAAQRPVARARGRAAAKPADGDADADREEPAAQLPDGFGALVEADADKPTGTRGRTKRARDWMITFNVGKILEEGKLADAEQPPTGKALPINLETVLLAHHPLNWTAVTEDHHRFVAGQGEVGKTGNPHWQVFLSLSSPQDLKWILDHTYAGVYARPRFASVQTCVNYVSKEGTEEAPTIADTFFSDGHLELKPGRRTDIEQIHLRLLEWAKPHKCISERKGKGLNLINHMHRFQTDMRHDIRNDWPTELLVYTGTPGAGKTTRGKKLASDRFPEPSYWGDNPILVHSQVPGGYWNGYRGQPVVLWDEFDHANVNINEILRLTDYAGGQMVNVKNGYEPWLTRVLILCCNDPIENWWPYASDDKLRALNRRIKAKGIVTFKAADHAQATYDPREAMRRKTVSVEAAIPAQALEAAEADAQDCDVLDDPMHERA